MCSTQVSINLEVKVMKILIWAGCIILANLVWDRLWALLSPYIIPRGLSAITFSIIILFAILYGITIAVAHSLCQKYETYKGHKDLKKKRRASAAAQEEPPHTEEPSKTSAAHCPKCGKKLSDNRQFCGYCGAKVVTDSEDKMS